jgi:hypothetical protein
LRLRLARQYDVLEYPDLATAEAYNALLLVDEITDEYGEWHDRAVSQTLTTLEARGHLVRLDQSEEDDDEDPETELLVELAEGDISLLAYVFF